MTRASTKPHSSALMPDVPSVAELGYPAMDTVPFITLVAPAATPTSIVDKLNEHTRRALQAPEVRAKLTSLYFEVGDGGEMPGVRRAGHGR